MLSTDGRGGRERKGDEKEDHSTRVSYSHPMEGKIKKCTLGEQAWKCLVARLRAKGRAQELDAG
jgi:hypothetical protein